MPRAIWSGAISFGLVNVPVRMYSAVAEHDLHFHFVHEPDGSRIGYEKVCKAEGRPVPAEEIVKAFEYERGEYVYMTDEDFKAAGAEADRTIDLRDFVPYDEIDPIFFEKTYYLGPQSGSEKVYVLLARAMAQSGLAAIAKYVMRDRQSLGCLRVREGVITLEKMYFADEVRPVAEIAPEGVAVEERELELAAELIGRLSAGFEPERYEDSYRDALCEIIEAKRKGEEVRIAPKEAPEEPPDLLSALRASLEASQPRRSEGAKRGNGDLGALSREQLYERAKRADVRGRSDMTKDQLLEALQQVA